MQSHAITVYRNDIETNPSPGGDGLGKVGREFAQRSALPAVNCRNCRTKGAAFAPLHLHEDEGRTVDANDVDLATWRP
jgi:hypothetical protein